MRSGIPAHQRCMDYWLSFRHASATGIFSRWYFFPICLIAICGTAVFIGAVPTRVFGHDIFFLLDNGWRVVNGQRPHVDFASPWGPVTFLIGALGLILSGYTVDGIGYGSAIFGLLIGIWSHRLGQDRLEPVPRLLMSLYLAGLVVAPYSLGWGVFHTSHAMVYNRYGYALLGLVMLESFEPIRNQRRGMEEWAGGISSGAALALALFLKVTYFLVATLLVGASLFLRGGTRRRLTGVFVGFSLVAIAMLAFLGFDVQAVIEDWRMAAGARSESFPFSVLKRKFLTNTPYLVLIVWLGIRGSLAVESPWTNRRNFHLLLLAALVIAADMLLLISNQQRTELPLTGIFSLFVVSRVLARNRTLPNKGADPARRSSRVTLFAGGLLFMVPFACAIAGLGYGALLKAQPSRLHVAARFTEPRLAPLLLYDGLDDPRSNGRQYTTYVNEGIDLLRQYTGPDETVLTMDMMNPFSYAMGRTPAIGGIAAAAYRYTLSDTHRPSDDRFFGSADIVMVPKQPASPGVYYNGFYEMYKPTLQDRFRLSAESDMWYLYRRK